MRPPTGLRHNSTRTAELVDSKNYVGAGAEGDETDRRGPWRGLVLSVPSSFHERSAIAGF